VTPLINVLIRSYVLTLWLALAACGGGSQDSSYNAGTGGNGGAASGPSTGTGTDAGPGSGTGTGGTGTGGADAGTGGTGTGTGGTGTGTGGTGTGTGGTGTGTGGTGTGTGGTGTGAGGTGTGAGGTGTGTGGTGTGTGGTGTGTGGTGTGTGGTGTGTGGTGTGTGGTGTGTGGTGTGTGGTGTGTGGTGTGSGDGVAAAPGDGGGVGSGGTGVTASAVGIGVADGFGSVIVNGVRFATDTAQITTEDAPALRLGMTVLVSGTVQPDLATGVATAVLSVPEFRGPVTAVDLPSGEIEVWGTRISVDDTTVYDGVSALASVTPGMTLQIYALPLGDGRWRATRVERKDAALPLVMAGAIEQLDTASKTFRLDGQLVNYGAASFNGTLVSTSLANGMVVYVRATALPANGVLNAQQIRRGHTLPTAGNSPVNLLGIVSQFNGVGSEFLLYGTRVNIASALITGGQASNIGNGVKLEVAGTMVNGVLVAKRARIRYAPGVGGPASFEVIGAVAQYRSLSDFRVNGQPANAAGENVVFMNGTAKDLRNGARVTIRGRKVVAGVLQVTEVQFP